MAYKEFKVEKLYYSITELAEMFEVNASLIRFWETKFDDLKPRKNSKGTRKYTKDDINTFALIYDLVKEQGYTIEGANDQLRLNKKAVEDKQKMLKSLNKVKSFLVDLRDNL